MIVSDTIDGLQNRWRILEKLAEGDTGDVFRVRALRAESTAILKRPAQEGLPDEIARQAEQINLEARILKVLGATPLSEGSKGVKVPRLLDESMPGSSTSTFIVVEEAPGASLASLARLARFKDDPNGSLNRVADQDSSESGTIQPFLDAVAAGGLPRHVLLRTALGLLHLFDIIHTHPTRWIDSESSGVIWNDVKPAHLFWDPAGAALWVIDWGNAQFLEPGNEAVAREDYHQFFEEIGRLVVENDPSLYAELEWPDSSESGQEELAAFRSRLSEALDSETARLNELRGREAFLAALTLPDDDSLSELSGVQDQILGFGLLPDHHALAGLRLRYTAGLVRDERLDDFRRSCSENKGIPGAETEKWNLLAYIADEIRVESDSSTHWQLALLAGLEDNWTNALWKLCELTAADASEARWKRLWGKVRRMTPEIDPNSPTSLAAVLELTRQMEVIIQRPEALEGAPSSPHEADSEQCPAPMETLQTLLGQLKNIVIKKWSQTGPVPPGADLTYQAIDEITARLKEIAAGPDTPLGVALADLERALAQPRAQSEIFMDAWRGRGFRTAGQGLRHMLVWDPDRRRVLRAYRAVEAAPAWLDELSGGPQKGERLPDFCLRMEFQGRELRSQVASAGWLEAAIGLLAELRSGARPGDLVQERPELTAEFSWLRKFKRRQVPELVPRPAISYPNNKPKTLREGSLGQGGDLLLAEALDTWAPEARGSSARVFLGYLSGQSGALRQAAIKLMRSDKVEYALPLFAEEARVLTAMQDVPGVMKWLECGFLHLDDEQELPHENRAGDGRSLTGALVRLKPDEAGFFLSELDARASDGWLPYLALEKKNNQDNLLALCDTGYTQGSFLPLELAAQIAIQITDILQAAHERQVVYRDHKILHYYWHSSSRRVTIIDWNVARLHPGGLPEGETRLDLVQFGARALHHLFTGRPAPGALPAGPTSPQEIETAPVSYDTAWTYDDQQRLPVEIRQLIAEVLNGAYDRADRLKEDLLAQAPA
jgi:serine/threonine protein kinase